MLYQISIFHYNTSILLKNTVYLQIILNFQSFLKMSSEKINPYKEKSNAKTEQVAEMFDNISGKYDFLNHFFYVGLKPCFFTGF